MKIEYVDLSHYGVAQLLEFDFTNLDTLFILVNCIDDCVFIKEVELLDQLDPTKIVFILYEGQNWPDTPRIPSSVLAKFKVISTTTAFLTDKYNFIHYEYWSRRWHKDKINIILLMEWISPISLSKAIHDHYKSKAILIRPRLATSRRLSQIKFGVCHIFNDYNGKPNKYLELTGSKVAIRN